MSTLSIVRPKPIIYPDSDGQPMAENSLQFQYIVMTKEGLEARYRHDANVFVAGDMLWYPVEGRPDIRIAPDVFVVLGRPKGHRGSYRQWVEADIAPKVGFEIMSPGNRLAEMIAKFAFYERYGVDEYYVYDPDRGTLEGWLRVHGVLREIENMDGWVSPALGVRFELEDGEMQLFDPEGRRFLTYLELYEQREQAEKRATHAEQLVADAAKVVEGLKAKLRAAGIDPNGTTLP